MMTLLEAAEAVGVSKSTMRRAVKEGKISATKKDTGAFLIDPSELFRAFPPTPVERATEEPMGLHEAPVILQLARLEAQLEAALARCKDLEQDRDRWHEQAQRLALPPPQKEGLIKRLFGKAA